MNISFSGAKGKSEIILLVSGQRVSKEYIMEGNSLLIIIVVITVLALCLFIYLVPRSGLLSRRSSRRLTLRDGITELDFSGIRRKLATNTKYQRSETRIHSTQTDYTRFLFLIGTNPGQVIILSYIN